MTVLRTELVAPSMRRVVFGGDGFTELVKGDNAFTDKYVKLVFLAEGFDYPEPLDLDVVRATMPGEAWPVLRTYTVVVDPETSEVVIDFVVHGAEGVAGPWATKAQPGDVMHLRGPSGAYAPDTDADWHLFVGDESAIPAIRASLDALGHWNRAVVFLEVEGPADERDFSLEMATAAELELHWLHRGDAAPGTTTLLDDAVRTWTWRPGRVQAFAHGEAGLLKSVRPYVLNDRGVARADVSVSGYWRRGATEEGFRVWKSQQDEAVLRPRPR